MECGNGIGNGPVGILPSTRSYAILCIAYACSNVAYANLFQVVASDSGEFFGIVSLNGSPRISACSSF